MIPQILRTRPRPSGSNKFLNWRRGRASGAVPGPNGLYQYAAGQNLPSKREYCLGTL